MTAEKLRLGSTDWASQHFGVERLDLGGGQVGGEGRGVAMIGGGGAGRTEMGAAVFVRAQIAGEAPNILPRHGAEAAEIIGEARCLRVHHRIGAVGGDDAALPAALPDRLVVVERIERALGGGDELDPETLVERAGAEGIGLQRGVDSVVIEIGGGGLEPHVEPEHLGEHPV